ncbi:hypothetical protein [Lentzea sp. NPDC003310]|uniref:hypothetical protein n=1 Tax=Lentzea sp. NPDC003310 TaxID=3154447 RepID=UPI0033AD317F
MLLPTARGPLSAGIIAALLDVEQARPPAPGTAGEPDRLVADADFQLALWISLEMLDGGFDGVAPDRAEEPGLLHWQTVLSERWMAALRALTAPAVRAAGGDTASPARVGDHLISLMRSGDTALYSFIETKATAAQVRELVTAKSLVSRQADRHAVVERLPAVAIAAHNTMRVLGLGHAESATAAGHQAASAALSLISDRRLAAGLHRLGLPSRAPVRVQETAEQRWLRLLTACRDLLAANPARTQDLLHAAAAAVEVETRLCEHLLRCWTQAAPALDPQRPVAVTVIGDERLRTPAPVKLGPVS